MRYQTPCCVIEEMVLEIISYTAQSLVAREFLQNTIFKLANDDNEDRCYSQVGS